MTTPKLKSGASAPFFISYTMEELRAILMSAHNHDELSYWSNEEPEAFIVRNKTLFDGCNLPYNDQIKVVKEILTILPEKVRDRGILGVTSPNKPLPTLEPKTSNEYGFTLVIDEKSVRHRLIVRGLNGEGYIEIPISSDDGHKLKEMFGVEFDNESRQMQLTTKKEQ